MSVGIPDIFIGKDGRDIIISDGNMESKTINNFINIKLNKN